MENTNKFKKQGRVRELKGTILEPENAGLRFILSINNLEGKSENPLLPIFDKKWRQVRTESRGWYATKTGAYKLGAINTTAVQSDTWVIHMLCQDEKLVTSVKGLEDCLKKVCASAKYEQASIHVSNILTDLIPELKPLIIKHLVEEGVNVNFYKEQ